jgi:membrane protein required for beta-lactamase induction
MDPRARSRRNLAIFWLVLLGVPVAAAVVVMIAGAVALSNPAYQ